MTTTIASGPGWLARCDQPCGWESWHPRRTAADRAARTHHAAHLKKDQT